MAFSDETKRLGFERCGGICECTRRRCAAYHTVPFVTKEDGTREHPRCGNQAEHAHHIKAQKDGGSDELSNLEYLCEPCHMNTDSYGG